MEQQQEIDEQEEDYATKRVLTSLGLTREEIDIYFTITGRGPVSVGEIQLLLQNNSETPVDSGKASIVASNLLEKGLLREIPGKTPYYMAIPPYTALLSQIKHFKDTVADIQKITPEKLNVRFDTIGDQSAKIEKFDEYIKYIKEMQQTVPNSIKKQFNKFDKELEQTDKLIEMKQFVDNLKNNVSRDVNREFDKMADNMTAIQDEIADAFERQFRIGALKNVASKISAKILEREFMKLNEYVRQKFVQTTADMLTKVSNQLEDITGTAGEISGDLGSAFEYIDANLKITLEEMENKVKELKGEINQGIGNLRSGFQQEVNATLEKDVIYSIVKQLEMSEQTMKEFWDRSLKSSMLTFKDVWFIRSEEAMKAQINESLTRAKMKVFIIAPHISDIDLVALKRLKQYINVRISTDFNFNDESDRLKLDEINKIDQVNVRNYPRKNLWAINKDNEEIVLCVISKTQDGRVEIAGMGSVIEEHIKLFNTVIEDIWIQSKKIELMRSM